MNRPEGEIVAKFWTGFTRANVSRRFPYQGREPPLTESNVALQLIYRREWFLPIIVLGNPLDHDAPYLEGAG